MTHDDPERTRREVRQRARELRELRHAERDLALHHPDELLRIRERGPDLRGTQPEEGADALAEPVDDSERFDARMDSDFEVVDDLGGELEAPGLDDLL